MPQWFWFLVALLVILAILWLVGIRFNAEFVLPAFYSLRGKYARYFPASNSGSND